MVKNAGKAEVFNRITAGRLFRISGGDDPTTDTEVSIVGPRSVGEETLKRNAINKFRYVLAEKTKNKKGQGLQWNISFSS